MKEIKSLRKRNEKHFLNKDGTITAYLYNNDIHYLKNGEYEEIDNTIIEDGENLINKANAFQTFFQKDLKNNLLVDIKKDNHYLKMFLNNNKSNKLKVTKNKAKVNFKNILENIDFNYDVMSTKLKESIILKNKNNVPKTLSFIIDTDLKLRLNNKRIEAKKNNDVVFVIDAPYMWDSNNNYNYDIKYDLILKDNTYFLTLNLDLDWLEKATFPVTIDPTIVANDSNVHAAHIHTGDTNVPNHVYEKLRVGVDSNNTIYRTLLKFDLPTIGTGCDIISAKAYLTSHFNDFTADIDTRGLEPVEVHALTCPFEENYLTKWNTMSDKYDEKVIDFAYPNRTKLVGSTRTLMTTSFDITSLVKTWYNGESNFGIMLKAHNEVYNENCKEYTFYSVEDYINQVDIPKPFLVVTYRNQNGLEDYMSYKIQKYTDGASFINVLTGNLTTVFNLNQIIGTKYPINLSMVYNTNDMVLNNDYGYKPGYKLNLHETIKEIKIDNEDYLEYLDGDGTVHYFVHDVDDDGNAITSEYVDEDGLGLTATLGDNPQYIIKDKNNYKYTFTKKSDGLYHLSGLENSGNDSVLLGYDSNYRIISITDASTLTAIRLKYNTNSIEITSDSTTTTVNYTNNLITSIETKNGTTTFEYDSHNLIKRIIDVNGLSNRFNYYDVSPYRIQNVIEYNLNDIAGGRLTFEYGFLTTRVKDWDNNYNTYNFNVRGNTIGITNLDKEKNLNNAYGKGIIYENDIVYNDNNIAKLNKAVNNISNEILPVKYTKNLISNSSFEDNPDLYGVTNEYARTGEYSYKINGFDSLAFEIEGGKTYTFSGYFKNESELNVEITTQGFNSPEFLTYDKIPSNEDFERYSFTFALPDGKTEVDISISGNAYIDDIQLEEGEIANYYNMLDNGDFSNGLNGWNLNGDSTDGLVTLSNGMKALKLNPDINKYKSLSKTIKLKGYKTTEERGIGDVYYLSFWYKNTTLEKESNLMMGSLGTSVLVNFLYPDDYLYPGCALPYSVIPSNEEWQFFSAPFYSDSSSDYENLYLTIFAADNVNEFLVTNISLTKDVEQNYSKFNSNNGNLESTRKMDNSSNEFKYDKNNQLISMFNPRGNNFRFEYDDIRVDRLLRGISPSGISNEIKYDNFNNPVKTIISNVNPIISTEIAANKNYRIRHKETDKYFDCDLVNKTVDLKTADDNINAFKLTKSGGYYYLEIDGLYLTINLDKTITLSNTKNSYSQLKLTKKDNGSYLISNRVNSLAKVCYENNNLTTKVIAKNVDDSKCQFYFEDTDSPIIESKAEYTENGKFVNKIIDPLNKETIYNVDNVKGLIKSMTDSNNNTVNYTYNNKDQVTKVSTNGKEVNYTYNNQNLLSKITSGNKEYSFTYDNCLYPYQVKINDKRLVTNDYDSYTHKLAYISYGNNHSTDFDYDELYRLKTKRTMTDTYNYIYDNVGNLAKIKAKNEEYNYSYDFSNRLSKYNLTNNFNGNEFTINYDYDSNDNVIKKDYNLNNQINSINYEYNEDDALTEVLLDDNDLSYTYDYLGRLTIKNINNQDVKYTYLTNDNKTSTVVETMKISNDLYKYTYDNLYNITDIHLNNNLINHYEYNSFNELIKEDDYLHNKTYKYAYDNEGNILSKKEYELNTDNLLNTNTYEYNNSTWEDQLTKYNNETITYDAIGNPLTIGDKTLMWINGRELKSYEDDNFDITYEYNKDGIRNKKTVNNVTHNYFTEGNKIIFEKINNNVLYYRRDDEGSLLGFKYNDEIYYYLKNMQEDITGIIDRYGITQCRYEYDSWGKIISVKDSNNNEITDSSHIALINPFRYRSYYYDEETKLYYLNSRYYNPEWGRFISADKYVSAQQGMLSINMYQYTENNPINRTDTIGGFWFPVVRAVVGAAIAGGFQIAANVISGNDWRDGVIGAALGGAVSGALSVVPFKNKIVEKIAGNFGGALVENVTNVLSGDLSLGEGTFNTLIAGTISIATPDVYKIGDTWIKPTKLSTSILGNYQKKMIANDIGSSLISAAINKPISDAKNIIAQQKEKAKESAKAVTGIGNSLLNMSFTIRI